ncbi:MAG: OsmC family protein [Woeseiaceae bacterium]|nr:OsmC family protein [Woeseiaceae bacterium]
MQDYPHHYRATANAAADANVEVTSPGLASIEAAPPTEFGGPGDLWSPETLLAAAVANCFVLSFRAIARASKLEWNALTCDVEAVLDREDRVTKFTRINERVVLDVPAGTDPKKARRLLDKAEQVCLITNSMTAEVTLEAEVRVAG